MYVNLKITLSGKAAKIIENTSTQNVGNKIVEDHRMKLISFTGSSTVGRIIN